MNSPQFKVRDDLRLLFVLPKLGFHYTGGYLQGDRWERPISPPIYDAGKQNAPQGIVVHGDYDNRRIYFSFPYRASAKTLDIRDYIRDLIEDGIAVEEERTPA